jgi:phage gpG-like protein
MAQAAGRLKPVFDRLGPELVRVTKARFTTAGQPPAWPALKHPRPGPMLVQSGDLRDSITHRATDKMLRRRSSTPYGWYLQQGSRFTGRYISKRNADKLLRSGVGVESRGKNTNDRIYLGGGKVLLIAGQQKGRRGNKTLGRGVHGPIRQKRDQAGRGGIDARPFLGFDIEDTQRIQERVMEYVEAQAIAGGAVVTR